MAKKKKDKPSKPKTQKRSERRFVPQSAYPTWLSGVIGAVGAAGLGAGAYAYAYGKSFEDAAEGAPNPLRAFPSYIVAGGAIVTGVAIWLATSSEAPVRVGDPGIAVERGEPRRMPWYGVKQISWESGNTSVVVSGKDDVGKDWTFKVPLKAHPEAIGWLLKEATARIPKTVDISDEIIERLPSAGTHAGLKIELEPLQVVGRKCAASGKLISYEPDARVCTRCERVYVKSAVPAKCKCGASLAHLRGADAEEESDGDESSESAESSEPEKEEAAS